MPFHKVGPNKYKSPSGRSFTGPQVKLYYASGGFNPAKMKKMRVKKKS